MIFNSSRINNHPTAKCFRMSFFLIGAMALLFENPLAIKIKGKEFVLENGFKVIVVEDHKAPIVACRLYYLVGSVYENIGTSGLSHMLEHMMFKGTHAIGVKNHQKDIAFQTQMDSLYDIANSLLEKGDSAKAAPVLEEASKVLKSQRENLINNELWEMYLKAGGTGLNAYTSNLLTAYIVTLPANKIELFFWLESDRMKNPIMREFYAERNVVMEERRMRYEDSPTGRYFETLSSLFYEAHPLRIPTIGYMSDLKHLNHNQAMGHFKKFYVPNNAILVLVGDIQMREAKQLAEKYFNAVPRGKAIIPNIVTQEAEPIGEKRFTLKKSIEPRLDFIFRTPGIGNDALYAIDVIEGIFNGKSGRLTKRLVDKEKLCTRISAGNYMNKYISQFRVRASLKKSSDHQAVEKIIWEEISKVAKEGLTGRELDKVINHVTRYQVNSLKSLEGIADKIAFFEVCGNWRMVNEYLEKMEKVTIEDVKKAAGQFLVKQNLTIGNLIHEPK